jgi:hypothetical protein
MWTFGRKMMQTSAMMHTLVATLGELRFRTPRFAAFATAVIVSATLPIVLIVSASRVSGQVSSKRHVEVTVTDPLHRFVTGLEQEHFELVENGIRRAITDFSGVDSPISLAIVCEEPLPAVGTLGPEDELIQTPSLSNALRQLSASKNSRKALVVTTTTETQAIPGGIQTLQINRANLLKAVVELRNQYRLEFESSSPSASVEVVLKPPRGLPPLQPNFLAPH